MIGGKAPNTTKRNKAWERIRETRGRCEEGHRLCITIDGKGRNGVTDSFAYSCQKELVKIRLHECLWKDWEKKLCWHGCMTLFNNRYDCSRCKYIEMVPGNLSINSSKNAAAQDGQVCVLLVSRVMDGSGYVIRELTWFLLLALMVDCSVLYYYMVIGYKSSLVTGIEIQISLLRAVYLNCCIAKWCFASLAQWMWISLSQNNSFSASTMKGIPPT